MSKKSQLTLFILAAIILLFALFFFSKYTVEKSDIDTRSIENAIQLCLKQTSTQAITELGQNGGASTLDFRALPTISEMEATLSTSVEAKLVSCISTLIEQEKAHTITTDQPKLEIKINPNNIGFNLLLNAKVQSNKNSKQLESFTYVHEDIRLPYLHLIAKELLKDDYIDITKLDQYGVGVDILPGDGFIVYSITDNGFGFNVPARVS